MSTMMNSYKEEPGVKTLHKGHKLFPKGMVSGLTALTIGAVVIALLCAGLAGIVIFAATTALNISIGWAYAAAGLVGATVLCSFGKQPVSWVLNSPTSPFVVSRQRKANIDKTRAIAHHLGASVVPVLTAEHIQAIQTVHEELEAASSRAESAANTDDYDRIAVLLLEDLKREYLILDLIQDRGLTTMDQIEAALHQIETETVIPLQDGWL